MENQTGTALSGIRVLDLSRVLAGPFCTMMLGDLGAEIIKVEVPKVGDDSRNFPPFIEKESAYFMNLNRNKKSIVIDLKKEGGKKTLSDLILASDVLVENFRPGVMEKLGFGFEKIKKLNPRIIYSSISGFGQYGPYKDYPGYDIIGQAMGGVMSVTGTPDSPPTRVGTAIGDVVAGLFSAVGILSALIARQTYGKGQAVDVSLVDSIVSAMETIIEIGLVEKRNPQRTGNRYEFVYPYDSFKAEDGWVVLAIGNNRLWEMFCAAIRRDDLSTGDLQENPSRVAKHAMVKQIVEDWTSKRKVKDIVSFMLERKIPCAQIFNVLDIIKDEHIADAREMIQNVHHPIVGMMQVVGSPIKLSGTPAKIVSAAPMLGEHTRVVLHDVLNYSEENIESLVNEKSIELPPDIEGI